MPITLTIATADLMRCRFAISPLWETLAAVRTLLLPERHTVHLPWLPAASRHLAGIRTGVLPLLMPRRGYTPDFLTPPPERPATDIDQELDRVRKTPPDRVGAELRRVAAGQPALDHLVDDPARAVAALIEEIRTCWHLLVEPDWPRIRETLDRDIAYRADRLTRGGIELLIADLHPAVRWTGGRLVIDGVDDERTLAGRGLVMVPSVFAWPAVSVITDISWQPTLVYPTRGIANLWQRPENSAPAALAALLGRTRASVLCTLTEPVTTTALAARLGMSPATISAHLTILRDARLATSRRKGHRMLYTLTSLGRALTKP
ncbi:ArsR/SmtB family transcription factor [Fodinicola acaciae]|uniref:ArsR/SmtB family transcription factor n=1 Tax=Fodinicola acaciae TaxID=2681555 RepID=UPI001C9E4EB2|nr:DUF5937 family protein [Fodinicola acaciae]